MEDPPPPLCLSIYGKLAANCSYRLMEPDEYVCMSRSAFGAIFRIASYYDCDVDEVIFAAFLELNALERRAEIRLVGCDEILSIGEN